MPGVDVRGAADALAERERRLVDQLADDPAEHEPGRVADPLGVLAERGEEALGGARPPTSALSGPRVSSTRLRLGQRRERVEADGAARRGRAPRASPPRSRSPAGRPAAAPPAPRAPAGRGSGTAASPVGGLGRLSDLPAGGGGAPRASSSASARVAGDHDQRRRRRRRGERLRVSGGAVLAVAGSRSSRGRTCGPSAPAATVRTVIGDGRQRGSPKLCS